LNSILYSEANKSYSDNNRSMIALGASKTRSSVQVHQ